MSKISNARLSNAFRAALLSSILAGTAPSVMALPTPQWVTPNTSGTISLGTNGFPVITPDARFVLFAATTDDMAPNDTNGGQDLVVRDLQNNTSELATVWSDGRQVAAGESFAEYSISDDGRYVTFEVAQDGFDPSDHNGAADIFMRDRLNKTTSRLTNLTPDASVRDIYMSGNAQRLVYGTFTTVSSLQPGDVQNNVYVEDLPSGTLRRINHSTADKIPKEARSIAVSSDGRWVLLNSADLVSGDPAGVTEAYLYDWNADSVSDICTNAAGQTSSYGCLPLALSANGRYAVFASTGDDLGFPAPQYQGAGHKFHLYWKDTVTGAVDLLDKTRDGQPSQFGTELRGYCSGNCFSVSNDGQMVGFLSTAWLIDGHTSAGAGYVRDLKAQRTVLMGVQPNGVVYPSNFGTLTPDGSTLALFGLFFDTSITPPSAKTGSDSFITPARPPSVDLKVKLLQPYTSSNPGIIQTVITNEGQYPASFENILNNITVSNLSESTPSIISISPSKDCTYSVPLSYAIPPPFDCNTGTIAPGDSYTLEWELVGAPIGEFDVSAQVRTNEIDVDPSKTSATLHISIKSLVPPPTDGRSGGGIFDLWAILIAAGGAATRLLRRNQARRRKGSQY